jgi:signal transduction histidine kinase
MTNTDELPKLTDGEPRVGWWATIAKYALGLAPFVIVWVVLVVWLSTLIMAKGEWSDRSDEAIMTEWIEETRPYRKTLPELVKDYLRLQEAASTDTDVTHEVLHLKRLEIAEQLRALAEPTRAYESKLPAFPVLYSLEVSFGDKPLSPVVWESPIPRPRQQNQTRLRSLRVPVDGAEIVCEYSLHAFNKLQRREQDQQRVALIAQTVLIGATLVAGVFVYRFLRRELRRENERQRQMREADHRESELLKQKLVSAELQVRADEAEKSALEVKSQLYASIGMAGSYAHNIKNLLLRPNDLLARCLESGSVPAQQSEMLQEVRSTMGVVTERLQQILKTVRRDAGKPALVEIDLVEVVRILATTWEPMAWDKWKMTIRRELPKYKCLIAGDESHLNQAIENLLFNARDATFEQRGVLRESARTAPADRKKDLLLTAASWKGDILLRVTQSSTGVVLEVTDNGIGMTPEVREKCLQTHFSTKRDNALFEGYSAGMGLGLSFVAMVFELHRATLEIVSSPGQGATFRVTFPMYESVPLTP